MSEQKNYPKYKSLHLKPGEQDDLETLANEQTRGNQSAMVAKLIRAEMRRRARRLKREEERAGQ